MAKGGHAHVVLRAKGEEFVVQAREPVRIRERETEME
jgi:hypothetical protein